MKSLIGKTQIFRKMVQQTLNVRPVGGGNYKLRSFCLSISKRNNDIPEIVDEYSDIMQLTKADTICQILREYPRLKNLAELKERKAVWN